MELPGFVRMLSGDWDELAAELAMEEAAGMFLSLKVLW